MKMEKKKKEKKKRNLLLDSIQISFRNLPLRIFVVIFSPFWKPLGFCSFLSFRSILFFFLLLSLTSLLRPGPCM
ncbi:hypothetical protein K450DRAFT_220119 [Umbelopsis ramanniana AG]|uniref:Transmembrane protein n=1 Tax=Umbelopsis ramanniana AG TaxID=1314678 RepID=A0AAD5HJ04_UMBRA|nr:uncharacterized protein K450DRAFT_220119 [Umbelopsis ramanniana AG]KAI8583818.1 hypothetical protein K450DRAFT_220119 [Umbelopsis ramanniana AG]